MSTVKFIGAWACIIAVIVVMILGHSLSTQLAVPLSLLSIAFSQAPVNG